MKNKNLLTGFSLIVSMGLASTVSIHLVVFEAVFFAMVIVSAYINSSE